MLWPALRRVGRCGYLYNTFAGRNAGLVTLSLTHSRPCPRKQHKLCLVGTSSFGKRFAATAFTISGSGKDDEQVLFVVGLNEGKFYGPDGSEEALKLLEQIVEHTPQYNLLFGLDEVALGMIKEDHKVTRKLTPSRNLESHLNCEFIPIVQAGMIDKRPLHAVDRSHAITQGRVSSYLWKNWHEIPNLFPAIWRRKEFKDVKKREFYTKLFPNTVVTNYDERAEFIALRTLEFLINERNSKGTGTTVLTVPNDLFSIVAKRLRELLGDDPAGTLGDLKFEEALREGTGVLSKEVPDVTPIFITLAVMVPILLIANIYFAVTRIDRKSVV